jgi:penicillin-binding protein 1A
MPTPGRPTQVDPPTARPSSKAPPLRPLPTPQDNPDEERTVMHRAIPRESDVTSPLDPATGALPAGQTPSAPLPAPAPKGKAKPKTKADKPKKKRGFVVRMLRFGLVATVVLGLAGAGGAAGVYWHFSQDLPSIEQLHEYTPPTVTVVLDRDDQLLGEIYEQRRYVVPEAEIPQHVKDAFIAAEDANFYNHQGVDPMGIARAMIRNVQAGSMAQGASTITQQVARNFLLTRDKKLDRKIKEMILAYRMDDEFTKEHVLYLYLNEIYLGSGAYGVEAASQVYFGKPVAEITLAEAALLAGLPQRPSDYSPHHSWDQASGRQGYVLRQMLEKGFIDQAAHDAAVAEHVVIVKSDNPIRLAAPYYTEHVRRYLVETYGHDRVYNEGLVVKTTCDLELQQVAQESVTKNVTRRDESFGWRGAAETLEGASAIQGRRDTQEAAMRDQDQFLADNARRNDLPPHSTLREGERLEAVVIAVETKHAVVGIGRHEAIVPLSWTKWGYEPNPKRSWRYRVSNDMTDTLDVGDVVTVEVMALDSQTVDNLKGYPAANGRAAVKLYQAPDLQGALLSYDLETGAVIAMVGGVDIEESEFNRAIQAKRQVGSTFKPVVYATAINTGQFTAGSMVQDAPYTSFDHTTSRFWKPGNYGEDFLGNITLRRALAMSRNVCTVRVMDVVGIEPVYEMARTLGVESEMSQDLSMALGSASLSMIEMARAYSVFATYGDMVEPYFIEHVADREGNVLEQHQPAPRNQVLDPTVAGITTWLLREVATAGTGAATNKLGIHVAGKTGTTNDYKDGWFVGFTPGIITVAWAGYDQPRSMGVSSTGGRTALPIWMDYMEQAWPKDIDRQWDEIPGASWAQIDESTGNVARGGRGMPFVKGTVPTNTVGEVGQAATDDPTGIY